MSRHPHRLLVITAVLSNVKSPAPGIGGSPNRITQSLIAALAGLQVPFLCSETHELGEELVASYLYQAHVYDWLETNDYGRLPRRQRSLRDTVMKCEELIYDSARMKYLRSTRAIQNKRS